MKAKSVILVLLLILTGIASGFKLADKFLVNVDNDNVLLGGYDVVAYFEQGKPVKGTESFQSNHHHAVYYFSSAKHKQLFDVTPEKYAPQYGGFCAVAASAGKVEPVEVDQFAVYKGKLYLQRNAKAAGIWKKNPAKIVKKANKQWPRLVAQHGKTK